MKKLNFLLSAFIALFFISSVSAISVAGGFNGNLNQNSETINSGESVMFVSVFTSTSSIISKDTNIPSEISVLSKSCESVGHSYYCNYTVSSSNPGTYKIQIIGKDSKDSIDSADPELTLTVNPQNPPINNPPTIDPILDHEKNENQFFSLQTYADDVDGDALTYSISGEPSGFSISSTGLITGTTPSVPADTDFTITVTVSDGKGGSAHTSFVLTAKDVNNTPQFVSIPVTSVDENTEYYYDVDATDADNDTLTYSLNIVSPSWLSINPTTGEITGTAPSVSSDEYHVVTVGVSDGQNAVFQGYTLWILDTSSSDNTKPVITILGNNPEYVYVGSSYTDAGATATDDVDGDLTSQIITTGTVDTFVIGTYSITYTVSDSSGNTATATRTVNVIPSTPTDTTDPVITIITPTSATYNHAVTELQTKVTDDNLQSCWYSTDNGATNHSFNCVSGVTNSINLISNEGANTWTVYAIDVAGNTASASVTFEVDTSNNNKNKNVVKGYQYEDFITQQEYEFQFENVNGRAINFGKDEHEKTESWLAKLLEAIIDFFKKLFGIKN